MVQEREYTAFNLYTRVLLQVKPFWLHLCAIFLLGLAATPIALLLPLPLKIVVDNVIGTSPLPEFIDSLTPEFAITSKDQPLFLALILLVLVTLLSSLLEFARSLLKAYVGEKMVRQWRSILFQHAQQLSLMYNDSRGAANSTYRIQYCAPAIRLLTIDGIIPLVTDAVMFAAMVYVIAHINLQLAFVSLAVAPILTILTSRFSAPLKELWRRLAKIETSALSVVQETLSSLRVVQAFGQEKREHTRLLDQLNAALKTTLKVEFAQNSFNFLVGMLTGIGTVVVLYIGVGQVLAGRMSTGDLLLIMGYLTQLYGPMKNIGTKVTSQQENLANAERAFLLFDERPAVFEQENAKRLHRVKGAVRFENISFSYDGVQPVLRNISVDIPAGACVGISGKTGAGKTTFVSLLIRFFDPSEGRILIDEHDVRGYKLSDLRNQFAIVLQEPMLFSTSIRENIAYGNPDASEAEIISAAKLANIHDFIALLPQGYDTQVGDRGMRLSGGERQRIGLARACLKDAPILIFDEPTSAVDVKTESFIMEAMERLMLGRTSFIIAHRLSTLDRCDVRIELEEGCISRCVMQPIKNLTCAERINVKGDRDATVAVLSTSA